MLENHKNNEFNIKLCKKKQVLLKKHFKANLKCYSLY